MEEKQEEHTTIKGDDSTIEKTTEKEDKKTIGNEDEKIAEEKKEAIKRLSKPNEENHDSEEGGILTNDGSLNVVSNFSMEDNIFNGTANINNGSGPMHVSNYVNKNEVLGLPTAVQLIDSYSIKFSVDIISQHYVSILLKERFIILNCAHNGIANSLKQTLAQTPYFESFLKYEVAFDDYSKSNISYLIEHCRKHILKDQQKLLLFIYDSHINDTPKLLKFLTKINDLGKTKISNALKDDIYIVYQSYYHNQNYLQQSCFHFYFINAFDIYVKQRSFSKERILLIKKQQKKGKWGNDKELLADLDKYETDIEIADILFEKEKEERIDFKTIIRNKKQPLGRYVLFVATFFPEITPDVFRNYINILIQDKRIKVKKKEVYLSTTWDADADDIIDDCHLISYNENNRRFIGFKSTTEALQCEQQLLKSVNFLDQQARILINSQQLFTQNKSSEAYSRLFPIITKLGLSFKTYYGDKLLKDWLAIMEAQRKELKGLQLELNIIKSYTKQIKSKIAELEAIKDQEDQLEAFKSIIPLSLKQEYYTLINELKIAKFLFYKEESYPADANPSSIIDELETVKRNLSEKLQDINTERNKLSYQSYHNVKSFSDLLSYIYSKDSTKDIVTEFFNATFKSIYRNLIVIDILNRFQIQHIDFNGFTYYKLALEHTDKKSNEYAFQAFTYLFLNHSEHFSHFIECTALWFPKKETAYDAYTKLEKYILATLYVYLNTQMSSDEEKEQLIDGDTQNALLNNSNEFSKYIEFIITNVYNKHLIPILDELFFPDFGDKDARKEKMLARRVELIEFWYQLLKTISTSQDTTVSIYVKTITKCLDITQRKRLIQELKNMRAEYNKKIATEEETAKKLKFKTSRTHLIEFTNYLNQ